MPVALERELETFQRVLPLLLVKEEGKFALIVGDALAGIYELREDALLAGYQKAKLGPFLVQRISGAEPILRFSRDIQGKWPTSQPPSAKLGQSYRSGSE